MGRMIEVKYDSIKKYNKNFRQFKAGYAGMVRSTVNDISDIIIAEAIAVNPTLLGRTGNLNESWDKKPAKQQSGVWRGKVLNYMDYAYDLEYGHTNTERVTGYFSPHLKTSFGTAMFIHTESGNSRVMPRRPVRGVEMLKRALVLADALVERVYYVKLSALASEKGVL